MRTPPFLQGDLSAISCPSSGSCIVGGDYTDTSGNPNVLVETLSSGTWSAVEGGLPSGGVVGSLTSIVCSSSTACIASGSYFVSSGAGYGLVDALASGSWTPAEAPLPGNASTASSQSVALGQLACPASGSCVDDGYYYDTNGLEQPLIDTLATGTRQSRSCGLKQF